MKDRRRLATCCCARRPLGFTLAPGPFLALARLPVRRSLLFYARLIAALPSPCGIEYAPERNLSFLLVGERDSAQKRAILSPASSFSLASLAFFFVLSEIEDRSFL